jgi:Tol biopolymer transport system component
VNVRNAVSWPSTVAVLVVAFLTVAAGTPPQRLSVALGAAASFSPTSLGPSAILSSDGRAFAFVAQPAEGAKTQLYVQKLGQARATLLAGTEGADSPFFSPDGKWIGFFAGGKLKKVAITGGRPVTICSVGIAADNARGATWAEDGNIFLSPRARAALVRVSSAGGSPEPLTTLDSANGEITQRWPQALLGGRAVLFTAHSQTGDFEDANIVVQSLPNGPRRIVQRGGYNGRYLPSGHLVFMHGGSLFAVPFDLGRLQATGSPVPVLDGIESSPAFGGAHFAFSARGALLFVPGQGRGLSVPIQWMDRQGRTQMLRAVPAFYNRPRFSPDGHQLVLEVREGPKYDVWIYDLERDQMTRVTSAAGNSNYPVWTPDGRRIAFASNRTDKATPNLYWQRADATTEAEPLTQSSHAQMPTSWHPGGRFLAFEEQNPPNNQDIMILPLEGDEASGWKPGPPRAFLASSFDESNAVFSPDGRWVAYQSNESGRLEVYVLPFSGSGEKRQVSSGGGMYPTWSRTRNELFYQNVTDWTLMVAAYTVDGDAFRAETPQPVGGIPRRGHGMPGFDVHPDGQRFAVLKATHESDDSKQDHVVLLPHFSDELRRIAGRPPSR